MIEVTKNGELTINLPGLYIDSYRNGFYIDFRNGFTIQVLSHGNRYSHFELRSQKIDIDISWIH